MGLQIIDKTLKCQVFLVHLGLFSQIKTLGSGTVDCGICEYRLIHCECLSPLIQFPLENEGFLLQALVLELQASDLLL